MRSSTFRSLASDAEKQEWLSQIREVLDALCEERAKASDWVVAQRLAVDPSTLHYRLRQCGRRFTDEKAEAETRFVRTRKQRAS